MKWCLQRQIAAFILVKPSLKTICKLISALIASLCINLFDRYHLRNKLTVWTPIDCVCVLLSQLSSVIFQLVYSNAGNDYRSFALLSQSDAVLPKSSTNLFQLNCVLPNSITNGRLSRLLTKYFGQSVNFEVTNEIISNKKYEIGSCI